MEESRTQAMGSVAEAEQGHDCTVGTEIQQAQVGRPVARPIPAMDGPFHSVGDILPRPLEWIWTGLIPRGKLTLVLGEPGVGKSLFALHVAAMVTRGLRRPSSDESETCSTAATANPVGPADAPTSADVAGANLVAPPERISPGVVLIFSTDDASADTVRPRLEAAHADLSRVFLMSPDFRPDKRKPYSRLPISDTEMRSIRYLEQLDECLKEFERHDVDVPLIIIDPIDTFLSCDRKEHDLSDKVTRLAETAARTGTAIVVLANSRSTGVGRRAYSNLTRGNEELANAARSVLFIASNLEQRDQRLVLPVKLNLSETSPTSAFTIQDQALTWNPEPVSITFEEYFAQTRQKQNSTDTSPRSRISETQRAMNWLKDKLNQGPVAATSIIEEADGQGISECTLRRAFRELGGVSKKTTSSGHWNWQCPRDEADLGELQMAAAAEERGSSEVFK